MTGRAVMLGLLLLPCGVLYSQLPPSTGETNYRVFPDINSFLSAGRTASVTAAQVRGVVSYTYRRSSFYMQDATGGLFISALTNIPLRLGDIVEVQGSGHQDGFSPILKQ